MKAGNYFLYIYCTGSTEYFVEVFSATSVVHIIIEDYGEFSGQSTGISRQRPGFDPPVTASLLLPTVSPYPIEDVFTETYM